MRSVGRVSLRIFVPSLKIWMILLSWTAHVTYGSPFELYKPSDLVIVLDSEASLYIILIL